MYSLRSYCKILLESRWTVVAGVSSNWIGVNTLNWQLLAYEMLCGCGYIMGVYLKMCLGCRRALKIIARIFCFEDHVENLLYTLNLHRNVSNHYGTYLRKLTLCVKPLTSIATFCNTLLYRFDVDNLIENKQGNWNSHECLWRYLFTFAKFVIHLIPPSTVSGSYNKTHTGGIISLGIFACTVI